MDDRPTEVHARVTSIAREREHLEQADRHIAGCRTRIAEQTARIAALERSCLDTTSFKLVLETLEDTLSVMLDHREMILREIERKETA